MHSHNNQGRLYKNYKPYDFRGSEYCDRAYNTGNLEFLESSPLSEAMIRKNVYNVSNDKQGTIHQNIIHLMSFVA